jgi:hypothetical protein
MKQRRDNGQFAHGNTISKQGWEALVRKRFDGDYALAKEWIGRVGANEYAKQAQIFRSSTFLYPGSPEEFMAKKTESLEFNLGDVGELEF